MNLFLPKWSLHSNSVITHSNIKQYTEFCRLHTKCKLLTEVKKKVKKK